MRLAGGGHTGSTRPTPATAAVPRTLAPSASSRGAKAAIPKRPGATASTPPETPLLAVARPAKTRIVVNQANDAVGYLIPQRQWDVEAPRAYEEGGQYGEQNSLGHTAAAEVVDAVIAAYDLAAR